jgi:hypothetical protein
MARITVQTDDHQTVLEERHVRPDPVRDAPLDPGLLERLRRAVQDAERSPGHSRRVRRLAAIVPARDYKLVGA